MSPSHPAESDHQGELDPLLAFNAEFAAAKSTKPPVDPPPLMPAAQAEDGSPLRQRLEQAERSIDRARIEIASLKSDLATLVTAVDDIKKRLGRRPEVVMAPPAVHVPHRALGKATTIVILFLTLGVAIWGVASVALTEIPETSPFDSARGSASVAQDRPIETESSIPPLAPAPVAVVPTPAVELQTVASIAPAPPPVRKVAERRPTTPTAYVGTLSIDAAPAGEVFIDRQVAGRTPLRAENLRAGSHLIWIEREGYRRWTRVVAVAADRVTSVRADLDPLGR